MITSISAVLPASAEEESKQGAYPYVVFAADEHGGITLALDDLTVNGNGITNGVYSTTAMNPNVNGTISENELVVDEIISDDENITDAQDDEKPFDVSRDMIYIHNKLMDSWFNNAQNYADDYTLSEMSINLNSPIYVTGRLNYEGNVSLNSAIGAVSDVNLSGGNLNGINAVIYSKFGDIKITDSQASMNGLIYAPFGTVTIDCDNFNLNGLIIAQNVVVNSYGANINYSNTWAEFVGTETEELSWAFDDWKYLADSDGDGVPNLIEKEIGTNPYVADADGDFMPDGYDFTLIANDNEDFSQEMESYSSFDDSIFENKIKSVNDLYGELYSDLDYNLLAQKYISSELYVQDNSSITICSIIPLFDANERTTAYAYNFKVKDISGYVIMGAHSKFFLLEAIDLEKHINENAEKVYYFGNGEIYYYINGEYLTTFGDHIDINEFNDYKSYKSSCLFNVTYEMLTNIENDNKLVISQINNDFTNVNMMKHYSGTDGYAYGYGGIKSPVTYLKDRYNASPKLVDSGKTLYIDKQKMSAVSGKSANNCSLVAVTKVIFYWKNSKGKTKIPSSIKTIYKDVEKIAKKYGYTDYSGVGATKINNVAIDVLKKYGYKNSTSNGIYVWTFNNQVKKNIDKGNPVIMNIARGYYGNHSVTVAGYKIYKVKSTTYPMIKISDGWTDTYRYIDYNAFAYDLATSGFGSFNTIEVK